MENQCKDLVAYSWISTGNRVGVKEVMERLNVYEVISCVKPIVDSKMNEMLMQPFLGDEVMKTLMDMHPMKSPGPDSLLALFFQNFWNINTTLITLIPKIKEPSRVKDFRPISLCNVLYKIVSRFITNRFRLAMHWIMQHRGGQTGYAALKLDMSRAYDMVKWEFLRGMTIKLGFTSSWVELIMRCVRSVSYYFLVQGSLIPGKDDNLIFCRARPSECNQLKQCLQIYAKASGKSINFEKLAFIF
ncbi:hypothetical protein UlMin_001716 [Ulmus minor]